MSRTSTSGAQGSIFHVYNRGVDKRTVFGNHGDYLRFYQSLYLFNTTTPAVNFSFAKAHYSPTTHRDPLVSVHAYALLPNHFHLLLENVAENGISEFMRRVSSGYTSYFNEQNNRTGALFQGTYKRELVESDEYYNYLQAYINENYSVHNIPLPKEIMYASTWHFQKTFTSSVLGDDLPINNYRHTEAENVARDIYVRRAEFKKLLIE